jgi:hypothetical protein
MERLRDTGVVNELATGCENREIVAGQKGVQAFKVIILLTCPSKVCGNLIFIVYLNYTSVFCCKSYIYGGVARVWCGVRVSAAGYECR